MGEDQSLGGSSPVLSAYCHCPGVKNSKFKSECDCVLNIERERERERERQWVVQSDLKLGCAMQCAHFPCVATVWKCEQKLVKGRSRAIKGRNYRNWITATMDGVWRYAVCTFALCYNSLKMVKGRLLSRSSRAFNGRRNYRNWITATMGQTVLNKREVWNTSQIDSNTNSFWTTSCTPIKKEMVPY
jgi:hypothetical protein